MAKTVTVSADLTEGQASLLLDVLSSPVRESLARSDLGEGQYPMHWNAAAQLSSPGTYFQTAAFCLVVAVTLIAGGLHQRRTGRSIINPDRPVRVGDVLLPETPPRKSKRVAGRIYLFLGWFLVLGGVINLVNGIRAARS
ncbi:hypothetical protein ACFVGN_06835 [Streptomyces sp. NPDC057757]|uniref:hypothetical protein n=1 Tax=Streptomyces sp. NPDC057757 TaxID=3346241 RepID=UPI00369C2B4B